jgi:hypothetical protein
VIIRRRWTGTVTADGGRTPQPTTAVILGLVPRTHELDA